MCADADRLPAGLVEPLDVCVLCGMIDSVTVRFVTHKDVDDADLERCVGALDTIRQEDS